MKSRSTTRTFISSFSFPAQGCAQTAWCCTRLDGSCWTGCARRSRGGANMAIVLHRFIEQKGTMEQWINRTQYHFVVPLIALVLILFLYWSEFYGIYGIRMY